jgi:starch-binding outer membrane protein, SusD/RagB family
MIRMKNKYIFFLFIGALLVVSCDKNKYLNPASTTSLPDFQAFDNPDRILSQVKGFYASTKSGNFLGGRYVIYSDVRADNFINETNNGVTAILTFSSMVWP